MPVISTINRTLERIYVPVLSVAFVGVTIMLTINVIGRYFFHSAFFWAEEVTNYFIIWITFLGSAVCIRYGMHVSVDMILQYGSDRLKKRITVAVTVICIVFTALLTVVGVMMVRGFVTNGQVTLTLRIPMYIPYLAIPVGAFLMMLEYIEQLGLVLRPLVKEGEAQ